MRSTALAPMEQDTSLEGHRSKLLILSGLLQEVIMNIFLPLNVPKVELTKV